MPDNVPAARAGQPAAQQEESGARKFFGIVQQVFLVWAVTQVATKYIVPKFAPAPTSQPSSPASPSSPVGTDADLPAYQGTEPPVAAPDIPQAQVNPFLLPPEQARLAWALHQPVDMHVYLSTSPNGDVFSRQWTSGWRKDADAGLPSFVWENISFGEWKEERAVDLEVELPESVQRNASLWADVFLTMQGASPDPRSETFNPHSVHHVRKLLTRYLPKAKIRKERSLLGGPKGEEEEEEEEPQDIIVSHWYSNLTLALISDETVVPYKQLPPVVHQHVHLVPGARDTTGKIGYYKPIIFPNDFWLLKANMIEINGTTPTLPLRVTFQPMSYFKFQLFASMTHGFDEAAKQQGGGANANAEMDEIKRMLVETNPWFLGLTGLVSLLHVLFEMLAFKSDVSHWRQQKELVELTLLSHRTIVTNVFVQAVVLLYLIDNNTDTSWMILLGSGMGVLIEAWKITKAVDISIGAAPPGSTLPYKLEIKDKHVLSEDEKKTQEYDKLAFRYVSWVAIPLLAAYTVYSLIYETHRGWYSFVISTLTSFVYMFGFAQLVPQLIINYKLKSVAHMPMKAMIYKTLSTVIDDLFAFCIKMPFLHRLACFRDDVVFLVFLYQRWIYRIDPKRVNEYGQVMAEDTAKAEKAGGNGETKKDK
ncbi:cleft lip and palate associated transmembrane protein [Coniophora puteana RWD-64-598 SS2]|uniref:Cleft lip and palate associated transmembrane protein n=1 Tax=Coniophora puteana (strain RWD-64-598) TaxID=741705 RepID=A0A5M3MAI4_CONPW|nr:cleft lip and palate associated transmembrane protein [Coniophora puteana RWD-64-598 SS2]EIW76278.1 cleft lip and palate associated transmembrane protein [Coniophora puteana RWD-64-598 SS2]